MPYTVRDTPEVVARIDADLAVVTAHVRCSDPSLRSLVLTGGFARGEGMVRNRVPQNDYDFVAVRGVGRQRVPYSRIRCDLEARLGLHIDLAPVPAWRIPWVAPSIFWYETALRGKVLWGENVLGKIPVRHWRELEPAEGLRLLVNRAAGLLLASEEPDAHKVRIQAAKALLAALDANLLALGAFAPSQHERWARFEAMQAAHETPEVLAAQAEWLEWAFRFKVEPDVTPLRDPARAWQASARALLAAVPVALKHAGLPSLAAYAKRDGVMDHIVYYRRSGQLPGAKRLIGNPTGRVRVATLRMLEDSLAGKVPSDAARRYFGGITKSVAPPLQTLDAYRKATLQ